MTTFAFPVPRQMPRNPRKVTIGACIALVLSTFTFAGENTTNIQLLIERAARAGEHRVVIPPGTYRLAAEPGKPHLSFHSLHDLEIVAEGVRLVFMTAEAQPLLIESCHDVVFRGATLLHAKLPYSQGRIEGVGAGRDRIHVHVAVGYPLDYTGSDMKRLPPFYVFDRETRQWKSGTPDLYPAAIEPESRDTFALRLDHPLPSQIPVERGDLIAWRGPGGSDIRLVNCAHVSLLDVTIKGGRGFCVHEVGGEGGNHYRCTVTYPDPPTDAVEPPLIASNADAFHSSGVRHGPLLEHCKFEGMCDDGIAIHGAYALAVAQEADGITFDTRAVAWRVGDRLRFVDQKGIPRGEARLASMSDSKPRDIASLQTPRTFANAAQARYSRVTLSPVMDVLPGWLAADADAVGSGFEVRDCVIRDHRARGILIKASNGVVENNAVERSTMAGIVVTPEIGYWNEADYSRDIEVRHNTIRAVGGAYQPWNPIAGAISIGAFEGGMFVPAAGHQNVRVVDNVFDHIDGPNVLITSAHSVVLAGNRFVEPMQSVTSRGSSRGIRQDSLIQIREASAVQVGPREIVNAGSAMTHVVDVIHSTGVEDTSVVPATSLVSP